MSNLTTAPAPTDPVAVRHAWRELGESTGAVIVAKIESEHYGVPAYLAHHTPEVLDRLIQAELVTRLADVRRLQPQFTVGDLLAAMGAG